MSDVPEGLYYTKEHEWLRVEGDTVTIGITDHAQNALTDIVYIELPESGMVVDDMGEFAVVEWNEQQLSLIPIENFSKLPTEGDKYLFIMHRFSHSSCQLMRNDPVLIQCSEQMLIVPQEINWKIRSQITWHLSPIQTKEKVSKR